MRQQGLRRAAHVAEIGLSLRSERGGNANEDGICFCRFGKRRGRSKPGLERLCHPPLVVSRYVGLAACELRGAFGIGVDADDAKATLGKPERKRQADVTETHYRDRGGSGLNFSQ